MDFGGGNEIRFERAGRAGIITLTRPQALNAVTHGMILALDRALAAWRDDADVDAVIIQAEGRAFSAGGDIMDVYRAGKTGNPPVDFFADEYRFNAALARFPKPHVALIDGIVMGGGVGVSFHGSHRVLGEKAVFAMPEVGIGFFPDVGGSYLLSRLKGGFGMYLALTGARIGAGDALACGLATHAVASADFDAIRDAIIAGGNPDAVLRGHAIRPEGKINEAERLTIGRVFTLGSLADIMHELKTLGEAGDDFAARTREVMQQRSPTSLEVAFRQIMAGEALTMDECMRMEFRIVSRMLRGHDFYEGIRAVLVDKGDTPKWRPATLAELSEADVEAYFAPLSGGELDLRA